MTRLFRNKLSLFTLGLLIVICCSCSTKKSEKTEPAKETEAEKNVKEASGVEAVTEPSNTVAKTGDYFITKEELEDRLMESLRSGGYKGPGEQAEPVDAKTVLLEMIAEKAMIMEARKQNLQERETIRMPIERSTNNRLRGMLLSRYLKDKATVTDSEIEKKIKANPKLSRERAKAMLERAKAKELVKQYCNELYEKSHMQKLRDNFPKASKIHQRLLLNSKGSQRINFVRYKQVGNELTQEEKDLVLAKYDYGEVTLKDWFEVLCEISPPSRPKNLHTSEGVERLLEKVLEKAILVSEAKQLGLDKDEDLVKRIKEHEDKRLFNEIRREKTKNIKEPTNEEEIVAYFNKNKEVFGIEKKLKIDQIWCQDLKTAHQVKAELDGGKDFEVGKQEYSLDKKSNPLFASPSRKGMFFDELWKSEPNEIVGPIKGFYREGFKWRVVKILEKRPGQLREYSDKMREFVKMRMAGEQKRAALAEYRKELLGKYPYEIYADRIKDIDPLNIP